VTVWEGLILGIVQGATEFLPVSSSGHLVIGQRMLGVRLPGVWFEVAVHLATLVSILLVYRNRVLALIRGALTGESSAWRYLGLLLLASVPAALVGILFEERIEALFDSEAVVGFALLATAGILMSSRRPLRSSSWSDSVSPGAALTIGIAQAFAIVPGISRSGTTVVSGLWLGVEPDRAAEFSFLMAVPAIGGAALLQFPEIMEAGAANGAGLALVAGAIAAGVTGVLAIKTFVAMLRRRSFPAFSVYCAAVGVLFLAYLALSA
jgi:undecaprenyl-diphosphatase